MAMMRSVLIMKMDASLWLRQSEQVLWKENADSWITGISKRPDTIMDSLNTEFFLMAME